MAQGTKSDELDTDSRARILEGVGMFGGRHRNRTLSVFNTWCRQHYCRPIDPWDNWELKTDEAELSLADRNFLEELLSLDGRYEEEQVGERLSAGFGQQSRNIKPLCTDDSKVKREFGSDFAQTTQTDEKKDFVMSTNLKLPYGGPNVITSSQIGESSKSEYSRRELLGSLGVLKNWVNNTPIDDNDNNKRPKSQELGKQLHKRPDPEPMSNQTRKQSSRLESETQPEDELEVFLKELSDSEAAFFSFEEAEVIRHDVESMIALVCNNLKTYRMFRNCTILKTGSTYEGVKIGKPDEFDFMIVLPALADDRVLQFSQDKYLQWHLAQYEVLDKDFFSDLLTQNVDDDEPETEGEDNEDEFMAKVRHKVKNNITEQLKNGQVLPAGWEFIEIPTLDAYTLPQMAVTPVLKWTGKELKNLYISIDISFAIPLKKTPLWMFGRQLFIPGCQNLSAREKGGNEMLLPDCDRVSYVLIRDSKCCRFSFSCQEQEIMNSFDVLAGEKRTFRLVKFLRESLMDQTFDADLQQLKSPISTYWLKTIMFYLLKKHENNPYAWDHGHIGSRVLEIFQVLHYCLISSKLNSFFIPGYNLIFLKDVQPVASKVQEVLDVLNDLKNGQTTRQQVRQHMKSKMKVNEDLLYRERREHLLNLFYVYAYNDYEPQDLETIKTGYVNRFLPGQVEVLGEGKNLRLLEAGRVVDIDAELERMYDERFSYFS